ncbi:MAG: hypothetical protein E6G82_13575 [Alphaproteobacteria bacterium]|nr:MAG: hypothetical protein E6G82_13575 [Alphaproteobacteria bacterium]
MAGFRYRLGYQGGCIYDIHRNSGWRSRPGGGSASPLFVGTVYLTYRQPFCPFSHAPSGSQENTSGWNNRSGFCIFGGRPKLEESPYGCRSVQEIFAGNTQPGSHHHCALILGAWQCETAGVPDPAKRPARIHDLVVGAGRGPQVFRQSTAFVTKVLRGGNPADMPVEQPTKFELVVNLRTAKALGITIPESFLLRADEVIE